jgi:hypothetical protein
LLRRPHCSSKFSWDPTQRYCVAKESNKPKESKETKEAKPAVAETKPSSSSDVTGDPDGFRNSDINKSAREKANSELTNRLEQAGLKKDEFIDPKDFDFLVGVAASGDLYKDNNLKFRDELRKGQASGKLNEQYGNLKNKTIDTLNCYGDGAILCLAALSNRDVTAKSVKLYGPEITRESMKEWEYLVKSSGVGSVELYILSQDPIPGISYVAGESWSEFPQVFVQNKLMNLLGEAAPSVRVFVSSCPVKGIKETFALECNEPKQYKSVF